MKTIFNKKTLSRPMGILVLVGVSLMTGCTAKDINDNGDIEKKKTVVQEDNQKKIMDDFSVLLKSNPEVDTIITFIDKNISNVSNEKLAIMINEFEKTQKRYLPILEEKYYSSEEIQKKIGEIYKPDFDLGKIENIKDDELKNLLIETRDKGYKVETAEGMYFPIINYEYYKKYSWNVTDDLKDYIDIMAVESNKVPAKDAGLVIGWDDIVTRTLEQEKFLKNYGNSAKVSEIEQLQKKYLTFMFYGTNNTPLFSYDSKVMVPDAKSVYLNVLNKKAESRIIQILGDYMDILNKTDYKLSDEADQFRKNVIDGETFKVR